METDNESAMRKMNRIKQDIREWMAMNDLQLTQNAASQLLCLVTSAYGRGIADMACYRLDSMQEKRNAKNKH